MQSAQDVHATSLLAQADQVMRSLSSGGKETQQIANETGLGAVEVAKTLHYLTKQLSPPFVETIGINDTLNNRSITRHFLTEEGKRNLPPPPVPKWSAPDVDPRANKKREAPAKPFAALKHIQGMNGKVRVTHDGKVMLGGAKGAVLETVRAEPGLSAEEIARKTKLARPTVWNACTELVNRGLLETVKSGKANLYREVGQAIPQVIKMREEPEPIPEPVAAAPAPVQEYKPADELTEAIRGLLGKHDATDIMLALISELDAELRLMREFKNRMSVLTTK